ncbi:MAG: AMP-binding protein [Deltaproteobacteria bacterium]|nr:AMP-binding protein [Deltaproteobacteria bacterium]
MNQVHYPFWPKRLPRSLPVPRVPLHDLLETSAMRYPDRTAIIYYGTKISYLEFWKQSLQLAGALDGIGIRPGNRVALYLQNSPHFAISFFGILRAGAVVVPLNPMLKGTEFIRLLKDSGARTVITTTDLYPAIAVPLRETGKNQVVVGSYHDYLPDRPSLPVPAFITQAAKSVEGVQSWADFINTAPEPSDIAINPNDLCLLPYTAGSTGVPKGCMHTHETVMANAIGSVFWIGVNPASVNLAALPFFHVTGLIHSFLATVAAGAAFIILTRWDREAALQSIEKYGVTIWPNITTMLIDLLAAPDIHQRNLTSLSFVGGGGAPLPPAVGEKLLKLTGLTFAEGYGLTETISQTHWNPPDRPKLGAIGVPVFGVDSRIVDVSTLKEVPSGQTGEIVSRGPQVFNGYWNKPHETDQAFLELDGQRFFRTGDIAYADDEGYFFVVDRLKRMINAAGFKVWPSEVEALLYRHPAVLEACIIGVSDPERVENVKAYIVLKPEFKGKISAEEIIDWSKKQMSAYKYPRIVEFAQALPKSGAGKILWRQLQEEEKEKQFEKKR